MKWLNKLLIILRLKKNPSNNFKYGIEGLAEHYHIPSSKLMDLPSINLIEMKGKPILHKAIEEMEEDLSVEQMKQFINNKDNE